MNAYIDDKIYGLPKPKRVGANTSPTSKRKGKEYVHTVSIHGRTYYKVHVKRNNKSKIRYFKKLKDAKFFVMFMRTFKAI